MPSDADCEGHRNLDDFVAIIIDSNKATLNELKTIYTLEEGYILWEIIAISRYNAWKAQERAKNQRRSP